MSACLIQMACGDAEPLLRLTEAHHRAYCERHGIEYRAIYEDMAQGRHPVWGKIPLIQQACRDGCDDIVWLDADCLIVYPKAYLPSALSSDRGFGMVANQHNGDPWHLNAGAIWTRDFMGDCWQEVWDGYEEHPWQEQYVLNKLLDNQCGMYQILHPKWNCNDAVNPCANPIVRAWHGIGSFSERLGLMTAAMAELR